MRFYNDAIFIICQNKIKFLEKSKIALELKKHLEYKIFTEKKTRYGEIMCISNRQEIFNKVLPTTKPC